ncbi:MAG: hypothetical protein EOP53_22470, partial [Sphingobacteriales bacterium]
MVRIFGLVLMLMFGNVSAEAQNTQEFLPLVKQAYKEVWKYNLSEAENLLSKDKNQNLAHIYVSEEKWFLEIFATEDISKYNAYKVIKENALNKIEAGRQSLPFYFFARSEIYLHSAIIKLKFGEYASA